MFERILVPLDGSKMAETVLPYVTELASYFDSRVTLARVSEPDITAYECQVYLENTADNLRNHLKLRQASSKASVEHRLLMGSPASQILKLGNETDCSLIAMTSRGASTRNPWPLGNVATGIVHSADFPVLLVRKEVSQRLLKVRGLFNRILVPLDGSRLSEASLPLAEELARKTGAEIVLLRVVESDMITLSPGRAMVRGMDVDYSRTAVIGTTKPFVIEYMRTIKESLQTNGVKASSVIVDGSPVDQILDFADTNSVDLIAMSTHGWTGVGRWVFGSVTEKVVHSGDKPVLVVRPRII